MRLVIRADARPEIGGGHLMRCLTLAGEAARRGHHIHFIVNAGEMAQRVVDAGFGLTELPPHPHTCENAPPHAHWLTAPWQGDAVLTAQVIARIGADWLIWDHYGLDGRWVDAVRDTAPPVRVLAMDDLDDRPLASDIVLDPAHMSGKPRLNKVTVALHGSDYALLRPDFAAARPNALARRGGEVRHVLILPGLMDAAGLAPLALKALRDTGLKAEVVMGHMAQSADAVRDMVADNPDWSLTLDATDMADRMANADLCIGAGGGTSWERCAVGLPTVAVSVADNQDVGIAKLAQLGAVVPLTLAQARGGELPLAIAIAIATATGMSSAAAKLCDGGGTKRVVDALDAQLRPLANTDAQQVFDWRNQPHIRAASHQSDPLVFDDHVEWVARTTTRTDGVWMIYHEGGRDLGFVSATDLGDHVWQWGFYIGEPDAPRGAGGRMLAAFLWHLKTKTNCRDIQGDVLAHNTASIALHERLGFTQQPSDTDGVLVFRRGV